MSCDSPPVARRRCDLARRRKPAQTQHLGCVLVDLVVESRRLIGRRGAELLFRPMSVPRFALDQLAPDVRPMLLSAFEEFAVVKPRRVAAMSRINNRLPCLQLPNIKNTVWPPLGVRGLFCFIVLFGL